MLGLSASGVAQLPCVVNEESKGQIYAAILIGELADFRDEVVKLFLAQSAVWEI